MYTSLRGLVPHIGLVLLATWVLLLSGGCGGERTYPVEGVVKFRGDPNPAKDLAGGTVAFTTLDLTYSSTGVIGTDGRFSLTGLDTRKGALAREYKVSVVNPYDEETRRPRTVHPKYGSSVTTPIVVEVVPNGPNQFEVVVDSTRTPK
jgi:hypothetical protein